MPILEFARNEAYGAMEIALTAWWVGSDGYTPMTSSTSVFKDFRAWHFSLYGYYGYPTSKVTFDGFVARGAKAVISNLYEFVLGIHFGDYMTHLIPLGERSNIWWALIAALLCTGINFAGIKRALLAQGLLLLADAVCLGALIAAYSAHIALVGGGFLFPDFEDLCLPRLLRLV